MESILNPIHTVKSTNCTLAHNVRVLLSYWMVFPSVL